MKFGLLDPEVRAMFYKLIERHSAMTVVPAWFAGNKQRQMQSINRFSEELYDMAEKIKKVIASGKKVDKEFVWKGFIDAKMSEEDKANYAAWDVEDSDVWDGIAQYCESGIKIAITYNQQNSSFNCAGTGQQSAGDNNGYCLMAHAKTPYEAARVWLFKVSTMLPAKWSEYDAGEADSIG